MTREEIKQEAEERVNICTPYHIGSFIQGYIAGAEPRENKIADIKANCDLAIEGRDIKIKELEDHLAEEVELHLHAEEYTKSLEKENAELKADYQVLSCSVGDFGELQDKLEEEQRKNNGLSDNLTKAKEIIREIMKYDIPTLDYEKAEQFLKEIEK